MEFKTLKQLEKHYSVSIKEVKSKYGFAGKVEKVTYKSVDINGKEIKFPTYQWLFTYDTFSKAQFIRSAKRELEKLK